MIKKIKKIISELREYLLDDGGDMEFVKYDEKKKELTIKIKGACVGCPYVSNTFDDNIKLVIMQKIPSIKNIIFI